jgi:hypothetical protein
MLSSCLGGGGGGYSGEILDLDPAMKFNYGSRTEDANNFGRDRVQIHSLEYELKNINVT